MKEGKMSLSQRDDGNWRLKCFWRMRDRARRPNDKGMAVISRRNGYVIYVSLLRPEEALQPTVTHWLSAFCVLRSRMWISAVETNKLNMKPRRKATWAFASLKAPDKTGDWTGSVVYFLRVAECLSTPTLRMETIKWRVEHHHGSSYAFSKKNPIILSKCWLNLETTQYLASQHFSGLIDCCCCCFRVHQCHTTGLICINDEQNKAIKTPPVTLLFTQNISHFCLKCEIFQAEMPVFFSLIEKCKMNIVTNLHFLISFLRVCVYLGSKWKFWTYQVKPKFTWLSWRWAFWKIRGVYGEELQPVFCNVKAACIILVRSHPVTRANAKWCFCDTLCLPALTRISSSPLSSRLQKVLGPLPLSRVCLQWILFSRSQVARLCQTAVCNEVSLWLVVVFLHFTSVSPDGQEEWWVYNSKYWSYQYQCGYLY